MSNFSEKINVLRAGVLGANDGIVSIAGVVIGVAAATEDKWVIFLSGLAAILAGAFSMAGGEYVSVSTQKDTEKAAMVREQALYHENPELARQSLYDLYISQGETVEDATYLTKRAFASSPVRHLVEIKYGIEYDVFANPWHAAISSFLSFFAGSLFPMLAILLIPNPVKIPGTVGVVILSLFLTGYTSAKMGGAPVKPAVIRNITMGLLTMFATYLIGKLFGMQVF